jgi:hypothetical protein
MKSSGHVLRALLTTTVFTMPTQTRSVKLVAPNGIFTESYVNVPGLESYAESTHAPSGGYENVPGVENGKCQIEVYGLIPSPMVVTRLRQYLPIFIVPT